MVAATAKQTQNFLWPFLPQSVVFQFYFSCQAFSAPVTYLASIIQLSPLCTTPHSAITAHALHLFTSLFQLPVNSHSVPDSWTSISSSNPSFDIYLDHQPLPVFGLLALCGCVCQSDHGNDPYSLLTTLLDHVLALVSPLCFPVLEPCYVY